jgi:hypothetical protein
VADLIGIVLVVAAPYIVVRGYRAIKKMVAPGAKLCKASTAYLIAYAVWFFGVGAISLTLTRSLKSGPPEASVIPVFPWPPPEASSFETINLKWLISAAYGTSGNTLSWVADPDNPASPYSAELLREIYQSQGPLMLHARALLETALKLSGLSQISYYSVPAGFAVVSKLERTDERGYPMDRASPSPEASQHFSLSWYLRELFVAPPGFYRLIVFIVTDRSFHQADALTTAAQAEDWLAFGSNTLPHGIAITPLSADVVCTALVYEFEKRDTQSSAIQRVPGRLATADHIQRSGIGRYLK